MAATSVIERSVTARAMEKETPGTLTVRTYTDRQRLFRAIGFGAACFGATVAAVFIPAAHFVLVPLGLLATPFVVYMALMNRATILKSEITCPACGAAMPLLSVAEKSPLFENCPECKREVAIRRNEPVRKD